MKIIFSIFFFILLACNDNSKPHVKSFEITLDKDTINMTDFNGLKQGMWIIKKDTIVDSIYYKDNIPQ